MIYEKYYHIQSDLMSVYEHLCTTVGRFNIIPIKVVLSIVGTIDPTKPTEN